MGIDTDTHFKQIAEMKVPVKRAAYSDRMAWTMSILAKLAYTRFDEESDDLLIKLAGELAQLTAGDDSDEMIKDRLKKFTRTLAEIGHAGGGDSDNAVLEALLKTGNFELVGGTPIHEPSTDTQAFVVRRKATDGTKFSVVCFRGTQQVRDWMTNLNAVTVPITDPKGIGGTVGNMHGGFHDAYKSVALAIECRLEDVKEYPIYVTEHSLGGALAVVATWYLSAQKLAACYTFGAPRVGDKGLEGRFKTPIYRVVNAADPVPFVPPSGAVVWTLKAFLRVASSLLPWLGIIDCLVKYSIKLQGFRHYGDMRYLPFSEPGPNADHPTLMIRNHVSNSARLVRFVSILASNNLLPWRISTFNSANDPPTDDANPKPGGAIKPDRIDQYHNIERYCDKLRAIAHHRN